MSQEIPESLEPAKPISAQPVQDQERIHAIDVLRGFALLGILPVNIIAFAHVEAAYQNPAIAGGFTGINFITWLLTHVIFEGKMVTLFSMLFGVGLFLQVSRVEERRGKPGSGRGLFFRRVFWLLIIGLIHAYVFWYGDILTYYALMGMLVYWFRRWKPRNQLILGLSLILLGSLILVGASLLLDFSFSYVESHPELVKETEDIRKMKENFNPTPAMVEEKSKQVRDAGFVEMLRLRAPSTAQFQIFGLLTFVLWRITGLMLCGIALYQLQAFDRSWPNQRYQRWAMIGLGLGILLTCLGIWQHLQTKEMPDMIRTMATYDYYGSLLMAAGYFAVIMLAVKQRWLPAVQSRLAAVGRMAFTNYLSQTLICTAIFHGWGLAQFGLWQRYQLFLLVIAIWCFQLFISPIWLKHFHFGPCEWVWRSLTYWKLQPMRR
ncbi:MAG: DUF418 domain-containing protein [Planctomycetia bacterium]|nr:DUF418 domain-containing protein [Planctomycetia bacterium]